MKATLIAILITLTTSLTARGQVVHIGDSIAIPDTMSLALPDSVLRDAIMVSDSLTAINDSLLKDVQTAIEVKRFVPDSQRALWFGLIFPGGGQIYNRKYWKLPIFYGGFLGCIYALNWNNQMYKDYRQAYLDIMDKDPETASYLEMLPINYDITGKEERFKDIFRRKKDYYRKYRDMSIFAMIGVWALSVIDAYVDAELSTFDISPDLSLQVVPTIFPTQDMSCNQRVTNTGLTIGLKF